MLYGNCVSCNFDLEDGNKRTIARVSKLGNEGYVCNDTTCIQEAKEHGWSIKAYSGKQTVNQPGEKGIFLLD